VPLLATKNSLAVVDPHSNQVVAVVPIGDTPRGVALGGGHIWTANAGEGTVSEIDPQKLRVERTIGLGAQAAALVEADGVIWVATGSDNSVSASALDRAEYSGMRRFRATPLQAHRRGTSRSLGRLGR